MQQRRRAGRDAVGVAETYFSAQSKSNLRSDYSACANKKEPLPTRSLGSVEALFTRGGELSTFTYYFGRVELDSTPKF